MVDIRFDSRMERVGCWLETVLGSTHEACIDLHAGDKEHGALPSGNVPAMGSLSSDGLRNLAEILNFCADYLDAKSNIKEHSWMASVGDVNGGSV